VSDPARPESAGHAALTELSSVIRHVTEQLAGFRRRALAAEARVRELEQSAADAAQAAQAAMDRAAALEAAVAEAPAQAARITALEHALVEARQHHGRAAALELALDEAPRSSGTAPTAGPEAAGSGSQAGALAAENAALRERLGEAVERTRVIGERVRFLRQQLGTGVEK
jgi:hypothetical protein